MTPADLENLVNEAAIRAVREGTTYTSMSHFQEALNALIKRNRLG
jgi:ATP-dependent Zn protease